ATHCATVLKLKFTRPFCKRRSRSVLRVIYRDAVAALENRHSMPGQTFYARCQFCVVIRQRKARTSVNLDHFLNLRGLFRQGLAHFLIKLLAVIPEHLRCDMVKVKRLLRLTIWTLPRKAPDVIGFPA